MKPLTITLPGWLVTIVLVLIALAIGLFLPNWAQNIPLARETNESEERLSNPTSTLEPQIVAQADEPTETLLPATPLSSRTPTVTLRPPPTLEQPTNTPLPSLTPSITPTQRILVEVTLEGLQGLASPTAEGEEACEPREDWRLRYEVQINDTLTSIAALFNSNIYTLADANCLEDPNTIVVGQKLRVPGEYIPGTAICDAGWEVLTPINYAWGVPYTGQIVFNWRGPEAMRNLVRIYPPGYFEGTNTDTDEDGNLRNDYLERTVDLRQNQTWDLADLEAGGIWRWQVYPLDINFQQICPESPIWLFTKEAVPPTATPDPNAAAQIPTGP